jgi:predicted ABC-type ATPase
MLIQLRELAARRENFAFETTLASRTYAPWLRGLMADGYEFLLIFVWLPSAEHAIQRVHDRVSRGGHSIPDEVIRKRYSAGLRNFFTLYQPLAAEWQMVDNSGSSSRLIASGKGRRTVKVLDKALWRRIRKVQQHEER